MWPIPPPVEQYKIASILSTVDESVQKTDAIISNVRQLKKGLLQQLFTKGIGHTKFKETEIGEMPEDWNVSTVGDECKVGTGGTPRRDRPEYFGGGIPWVKTTELDYNTIVSTQETITKLGLENSSARMYPKGTLLIAMYGLEAAGTRGRCAILGIEAAVNQACGAIQSLGRLQNPFLFYFYQAMRDKIMSLTGGTKRQNISLEIVKSIKVPVPSLAEQDKISRLLSDIDVLVSKQIEHRQKTLSLKESLMQVLLTGRVRAKVN